MKRICIVRIYVCEGVYVISYLLIDKDDVSSGISKGERWKFIWNSNDYDVAIFTAVM